MTKRFCDICGQPATEMSRISASKEVGEPHNNVTQIQATSGLHSPAKVRTKIVVLACFSFERHETGFGGPPDLCQECANDLLRELVKDDPRERRTENDRTMD